MQVEQSYDKVVMSHDEIQTVLKAHILAQTGRYVRGDVVVNSQDTTMGHTVGCKKVTSSAFTYLEPK